MSLLGLLVVVLLAALICWAITLLPAPPRVVQILQMVVVIAVIVWVISALFGGGPVLRVDG